MAIFYATFNVVSNRALTNTMPVLKGVDAEGLRPITTSSSSQTLQRGGADWSAPNHGYVSVRGDADMWIHIDTSPTAVKGAVGATDGIDWFIAANAYREFSVEPGEKIAVINA